MHQFFQNLFHFKNANHETYFYFTFSCFLITAFIYVSAKKSNFDATLKFIEFCIPLLIVLSFLVAISAYDIVVLRPRKSDMYSKDCIWYNSLMGILYTLVWFIGRKKKVKI
jgi:hypothetical protein